MLYQDYIIILILCMTLFIVINKVIKFRTHHQILWQLVDVFIQMAVTDEKTGARKSWSYGGMLDTS